VKYKYVKSLCSRTRNQCIAVFITAMSSLLDGKPSAPAALSSLPFEKVAKRIFTCKFNC